jgi:hypothetical protein
MGQLFFDIILHHTIITLIILCCYQKSRQKKVQPCIRPALILQKLQL